MKPRSDDGSRTRPLSEELQDAELGDQRLTRRLGVLVDSLSERASESFPKALGDGAALEAAYRFFSNPKVTLEAIIEPHLEESCSRVRSMAHVAIVHDTTEFEFEGEEQREGLGRLLRPGQGFLGHFALAVSADGLREPLGLVGVETILRTGPSRKRKKPHAMHESRRWKRLVDAVEARIAGTRPVIHVMDREADAFWLLDALITDRRSFIIRSNHDRVLVKPTEEKLRDAARRARHVLVREVPLSHRKTFPGPKGKRHPPREARIAKLSFAATTIELPRTPDARSASSPTLRLNIVHVVEPKAPPDEQPVEWFLLTTLPIKTRAQIAYVVDTYRARWTIEEYFKALKTGCQFEKRQLESSHSLLNALGVLAPIAWRLLLLRHLARHEPTRPATDALPREQVEILRAVSKRPLPKNPSVRDALLAVAALGGHIKNNGEPGWLVLGRGYHDLVLLELGWRAGRGEM